MVMLFLSKNSGVNSLLAGGRQLSQLFVMFSSLIFAVIFENLFRFIWSNELDNATLLNISDNSTNNLTSVPPNSRPTEIRLSPRFSEYDVDKNSFITLDELAKVTKTQLTNAEGPFSAADSNGDKVLDEKEFIEAPWLFITRKKFKHSNRRLPNNSSLIENRQRKNRKMINRKKNKQMLRKERNKKKKKRTTGIK